MVPRETFLQWAESERKWLELFADRNQLSLTVEQVDQLLRYGAGLREINQIHNLVSRKDEEGIIRRHIAHALTILYYCTIPDDGSLADWGSGGGIPGIPLSICLPRQSVALIDSIQKKSDAQQEMIQYLGLTNCKTIRGRIEELGSHYPAKVVVARAVADLTDLFKWGKTWMATQTQQFILLKGTTFTEELKQLPMASKQLIEDIRLHSIDLFGHEEIGENKLVAEIWIKKHKIN